MSENFSGSELSELEPEAEKQSWLAEVWEYLSQVGLARTFLRLGTHALLVILIFTVAWGLRQLYFSARLIEQQSETASMVATPTPILPAQKQEVEENKADFGELWRIYRLAFLHTDIPSKPRSEVITYTVQAGDTLLGIAERYGLRPETILWSNQYTLGDDPHRIQIGQVLNILPVDGAYHRWSTGDSLEGVAKFYGVPVEDIVFFPGNHLQVDSLGDWNNPNIAPGTWLVIPGGHRAFVNWSVQEIPRDNPDAAKILGAGACEIVESGVIGVGVFIWPTNNRFVVGYGFNPSANHWGIDIDGREGDQVYAVDNGVVVYAGWNDWGYGNIVVVNHGNGWQTFYAHLSAFYVSCGQSVWQSNIIGAVGATGNASGAHLHFEMMFNGEKVNPLDYLP